MNYELLIQKMEDQNLNLGSLAKRIGLSRTGLMSTVENKKLTVENLEKISSVLKTDPRLYFDIDSFHPEISTHTIEEFQGFKAKYFEKLAENDELRKQIPDN